MKFRILIYCFLLFSCKEYRNTSPVDCSNNLPLIIIANNDKEEYLEYLGVLKINSLDYKVFNSFKRIKAAEMWHGQSRLFFIGLKDTACYILDFNNDFPHSIKKNMLSFPQKKREFRIDSLSNTLCLPTGCVGKVSIDEIKHFPNIDSVRIFFKQDSIGIEK